MNKSTELNISDDLIQSADAYLERLPKTREEVLEKWAYLGKAVEEQTTELEQLQIMSGAARFRVYSADDESSE
ncbi:hypothetical protein [Idiomarina abyssalis]|uniref:hypothetical protein n=1 Tax=Idiomarina abyssalis TaxID=86102 RepID=UPI003A8CA33F